jgi:hypothetical protein
MLTLVSVLGDRRSVGIREDMELLLEHLGEAQNQRQLHPMLLDQMIDDFLQIG